MYNMERYRTRPYCIENPYWTRRLQHLVQYGFSIQYVQTRTIFFHIVHNTVYFCYFVTLLFCPLHQSGKDLSLLLKLSKVGALTTADGKSFQ